MLMRGDPVLMIRVANLKFKKPHQQKPSTVILVHRQTVMKAKSQRQRNHLQVQKM